MNKSLTGTSSMSRKLLSWGKQLVLYVAIFLGISWWQQRDMLKTGNSITNTQLSLLSVDGSAVHLTLDNRKTDSLLYFFAPWCSVCHASIDNLEKIYQSGPENLDIFVIALEWRSIEEVDEFLSQHQLSMPVLLGTREVQRNFKITAFPSYYLLSENGEVHSRNMGYSTELGLSWRLNFSR